MTPYAFCAFSSCHICGFSSIFCSVCALWARTVQGLFWLLCTGGWHADFGQGTIHGLRGVCPFSAPPPNTAVKRDAALKRVAPYF